MIERADAIHENPLASEARRASALDSLIRARVELGKIHGIHKQPTAEAAQPPAARSPVSVTNVIAQVAEGAEQLTRNFPGRALEEQLKHCGRDNISVPARIEALIDGVTVSVEDGDNED